MNPDAAAAGQSAQVLVVDDEAGVRRAIARLLGASGYRVVAAGSVAEALAAVELGGIDVVVSDVSMPGDDGLSLLELVRGRDLDLPVLFLTGRPSIETAARAVELGAFRYLLKPVAPDELRTALKDALRARSLARAGAVLGQRDSLSQRFHAAVDGIRLAFQPIVAVENRRVLGYEALMRSSEPSLPHPGAVLEAAEKLGELQFLGRRLRQLVAAAIDQGPPEVSFFVNLHPAELADPDLLDPGAPLSQHASRVVLELTERASLETLPDAAERIAKLRAMRFRIAIDDLGAGYAGLSYFASVSPDLVKIDMSLVRDVDADPVKQQVILLLTSLAARLGIEVVAEGVETPAERDALIRLGCPLLQGYLLARPGPPFPAVAWT